MNELIKEFKKQATREFFNFPDFYSQEFDKKNFAELIVRECAKRSAELGQPEIGLGILKHFGFEK